MTGAAFVIHLRHFSKCRKVHAIEANEYRLK